MVTIVVFECGLNRTCLVERRERNMTWNTQSSREAAPGSADDPSDHSWNGASLCPLTRREHHDYCPGLRLVGAPFGVRMQPDDIA